MKSSLFHSVLILCGIASPTSSTPLIPRSLSLSAFADWLEIQPPQAIKPNMGRYAFETTIDGVCNELLLTNWNCLYNITATGPNLAASLRKWSTAQTQDGKVPVVDTKTGFNWHNNLWAHFFECSSWHPESACGMVICCDRANETRIYGDPNADCPVGMVEDSSCPLFNGSRKA
ncbi:hypothetical protein P280DRAFT_474520 [Massarina eburnea CBS 473.64]|uniref:Uncharacterized protein n=1 Tax=Massarina eburnea CBS 473.64 TaxID=1395130 RepID=A0A6A6RH09_9PLEO|nr:hypothetical protein P280DRAFT_474520 [Massarina eburnea CBS 473.64]